MKSFLVGLFTTHLVTKVVSLLLASVLFVFTQQSISDTQTIEELTIRFELAPDLGKTWVLNNNRVVLRNLRVAGLRKDLGVEIGSLRRGDFVIHKVITKRFIDDYRADTGGPVRIDADLLRAESLPWDFAEEFQIELKQPGKLDLEPKVERTFRPTLSEEMRARLKLPESSPFRAANGGLQVEIEWVQPNGEPITTISISGPESQLPDNPKDSKEVPPLYIRIAALADRLRDRTLLRAREPIGIEAIDWAASGFGNPSRLYVNAPVAETTGSLAESTLNLQCDLKLTPKSVQVTLPFSFSIAAKDGLTLAGIAKDFRYLGRGKSSSFSRQPAGQNVPIAEWTHVVNLGLLVTKEWEDKQTELAKLFFLEIDVANATESTEGRLEIPIRLKARTVDAERILLDGAVTLPDPLVVFQG